MADANKIDEDIVVETTPTEEVEVKVEDAASPDTDYTASITQLQQQLESERQARQDAERRERDAQAREYAARNDKADTDLQLVNNAIYTVNTNTGILKSHYAEAMQAGDYARAAEIQQEMASNEAKRLQLENGKAAMEAAPRQEPPRQQVTDPVEALASQLTPRSAEWIRRHPEFARDQRMFNKMIAAHNLAVADGIQPDTDAYFAEVESTLKINRGAAATQAEAPMEQTAKVTQQRVSPNAAPAAAPVSRQSSSDRQTVVRLSAEEREMASMMKMTPEEYGKEKLKLKREGKIH